MSTANQHCRNRVQRLRGEIFANSLPGSQGLDPRTLRPERLKWLRNFAKSEPAAQIAALPKVDVFEVQAPLSHSSPHAEVLGVKRSFEAFQVHRKFKLGFPPNAGMHGCGE